MCVQFDIIDILKNNWQVYFVIFSVMLVCVPTSATVEFPVFRSQQLEFQGSPLGSQNSLLNVEARTLDSQAFARKCVLAKITDLSSSLYQKLVANGAAGLIIIIPKTFDDLTYEQKQTIYELEDSIVTTEVHLAVYFAYESEELEKIYKSVQIASKTDTASSAAAALLNSLSSDGYLMVAGASQSTKISKPAIPVIYGRLTGFGIEETLPTVAVIAHYDAFGGSPELSYGADSNGSGVIALLEIARLLSVLYSNPKTQPKVNTVFILSGGAYVNYQGARRFLEDQVEGLEASLFTEFQLGICLDTIANGDKLYFHVSKKPKESTPVHDFYETMKNLGESLDIPIEMVHKKINLNHLKLSWEHEWFSYRSFPAFTVSRLPNSETRERGSITDQFDTLDKKALVNHTSLLFQSIVQYYYDLPADSVCQKGMTVTEESIDAWAAQISSQPRSAQLLLGMNPFVVTLQNILARYVGEVSVSQYKPDPRDPEFNFYDVTKALMSAYTVKPASFDLFLLIAIVSYLGTILLIVQNFGSFYSLLKKISV